MGVQWGHNNMWEFDRELATLLPHSTATTSLFFDIRQTPPLRSRSNLTDLVPQDLPSVADPICPGMNDGETFDRPEVVLGLRRPPNRHRWHRTGPCRLYLSFHSLPPTHTWQLEHMNVLRSCGKAGSFCLYLRRPASCNNSNHYKL